MNQGGFRAEMYMGDLDNLRMPLGGGRERETSGLESHPPSPLRTARLRNREQWRDPCGALGTLAFGVGL
jgi:hypothetical protein